MVDRITPEQGAILTAFTGVMCCGYSDFAAYVERKLGKPIWTHQYPILAEEIKEAARSDFMAIIPETSDV